MHFTVPAMTTHIVLDTTINEPSLTAGEVEILRFALERSRATFAWKCGGLDAIGLGRTHPPSRMTLGGLLKHMARVEDSYTARDLLGSAPGAPWDDVDFEADPDGEWHSAPFDSPDELYALWSDAVSRSRAAMDAVLSEGGLDQASKYVFGNGKSVNLRRVLVDLHDEYARHVGHADLLREAIDGLTGEDPPQS